VRLQSFIRAHRTLIDDYIARQTHRMPRHNDHERRVWILKDETLYWLARQNRVRI
jgi:hypothetical protein